MIRLQNDDVSLTLEENGTLSELSNRKSGRILTLPHSLIRLIIGDPQCLELEAVPFGNPEIRKDGNTLYLHYPAIECEQRGRLEIGVELSIRLEGDEVQWGISLDNRTAEEVIREIHYPILTLRDPEPPAAAITSEGFRISRNRSGRALPTTCRRIRSTSAAAPSIRGAPIP